MRPRRCRPPVEHCFGVRPRKAAKWRADLNSVALATVATMAEAVRLPTPGMVARRRLASLPRCQARIACSICRADRLDRPDVGAVDVLGGQERMGAPSARTVQAPQSAMPQPNFVRPCRARRATRTTTACHP